MITWVPLPSFAASGLIFQPLYFHLPASPLLGLVLGFRCWLHLFLVSGICTRQGPHFQASGPLCGWYFLTSSLDNLYLSFFPLLCVVFAGHQHFKFNFLIQFLLKGNIPTEKHINLSELSEFLRRKHTHITH